MDEFRFDITPEIIEADITLANYIYNMNGRTQALLNMCGYHATQAIEKSLKLILYSVDPNDTRMKVCSEHTVLRLSYATSKRQNPVLSLLIRRL